MILFGLFFFFFFFSTKKKTSIFKIERSFAAGVRQGSSISNVKTIKFGRYEIPARLLKRWKIKHAKINS